MADEPERDSSQPVHPGQLRASDADRERVAQALHQAHAEGRLSLSELDERLQSAYAAKTFDDLKPLTMDLPGHHAVAPEVANPAPAYSPGSTPHSPTTWTGTTPQTPPSQSFGGPASEAVGLAVLSGLQRTGQWTVPRQYSIFALAGGGEIDLREARFAAQEVTITAVAIMGGFEIIVPDDVGVEVTGFGFMGGFSHQPSTPAPPGAPTVKINGFAIWGGVEVKRRPRKQPRIPS